MAVVRVLLDGGDYEALSSEMSAQGFVGFIKSNESDGQERLYKLPTGMYWMAEPTLPDDLRDRARIAVRRIREVTARIIVTSGESSWDGLTLMGDE